MASAASAKIRSNLGKTLTIYEADFSTLEQGQTTPEPSSTILLFTALGALGVWRKRPPA